MARPAAGARRFAEAAFEVALRDEALDRWRDELQVAADVLGRDEVVPVVDNPAIPLRQRQGLVERLIGTRVQPGVVRLVNMLVERGRIEVLPRVAEEYVRLLNTHRGVVMAVVTSAAPLTPDETAAIRGRVEAMAGADVELRTEVDPSLIGGLTVQVRDRLLDASVRGRLERLRDQLHAGGTLR
jgi:F-type H+-transporting ATPase subunit delta